MVPTAGVYLNEPILNFPAVVLCRADCGRVWLGRKVGVGSRMILSLTKI